LKVGHDPDFEFGKSGLTQYFSRFFHACCGVVAVVVVRPPETYCILIDGARRAAFRDSHRRAQLDFEDAEAFFAWIESSGSVFAPMTSCPAEYNVVALYRLIDSDRHTAAEQVVTTDATIATATPSNLPVEAKEALHFNARSKLHEDLLKENVRLVEALKAATAAGFVMPASISTSTTQKVNSSAMMSPDLPRLVERECQGASTGLHLTSEEDDVDLNEWVVHFASS